MKWMIRTAEKTDYASINTLYTEELAEHITLQPDFFQMSEPVMTVDWYQQQLEHKAVKLFVAELDGVVVGVIQVMLRHSPDDPIFRERTYAHIEDIVVSHQCRGKGIGRSLMDAAKQWALDHDASAIELWVWRANENAIDFYRKLGYETHRFAMQMKLG